jgi:hypothetical protein
MVVCHSERSPRSEQSAVPRVNTTSHLAHKK